MKRKESERLPINVEVGKRVRSLRIKAGLSQKALGIVLGLSPGSVSRIEGGWQSINTLHLFKIVQHFDITFKEILKDL